MPLDPQLPRDAGDSPGNNMLNGIKNELTEKISHCENNTHNTKPNVYTILYICPVVSVGGTGSRTHKTYV